MYFIVWDMFCGWSSYASHAHLIAEGESETLYELTPTPWGGFLPYGRLTREHYDVFGYHWGKIGANVLAKTVHEPITRVYVIERTWSKKYDLPPAVWASRYSDPQSDRVVYYHLRAEYTPTGQMRVNYGPWLVAQSNAAFMQNETLVKQMRSGTSILISPNSQFHGREMTITPDSGSAGPSSGIGIPIGEPLGN
jgi:hypothetical protein